MTTISQLEDVTGNVINIKLNKCVDHLTSAKFLASQLSLNTTVNCMTYDLSIYHVLLW